MCLSETGQIAQWPRPGGWFEQNEWEVALMRLGRYVQRLFGKDRKWKGDDGDFLLWMDSPDDGVFSLYHFLEGQWPELTRADLVQVEQETAVEG